MLVEAGDGRDSPLKYTTLGIGVLANTSLGMAGIRRSSTLMSTSVQSGIQLGMAGIRRSSTLSTAPPAQGDQLGMAGIHRSSTLPVGAGITAIRSWGWPGFTAQVHSI